MVTFRPFVQKELIMNGMIEWLLNYLSNPKITGQIWSIKFIKRRLLGPINIYFRIKRIRNSDTAKQLAISRLGYGVEFGIALLHNLCMNAVSATTVLRHKDHLLSFLLMSLGSNKLLNVTIILPIHMRKKGYKIQ